MRRIVTTALITSALLAGSAALPVTGAAAVVYSRGAPMIIQEVPVWDLQRNTNGICRLGADLVIKNAAGTFNAVNYLNVAQSCGLRVIFAFPETVNYGTGRVYTSRVRAWVNKVKNHPATWGYLSVKEPSGNRISVSEIRALYAAFKAADPNHPVMALFGDIPHFGTSRNPYGVRMADVVMVDWYPVETTGYIPNASRWFPRVRTIVNRVTPGTPVYLMIQTHKYLKPVYHKKARPTIQQLYRQVRDGFTYLGAKGIAYHVWRNTNYNLDQLRDPGMVRWIRDMVAKVRVGTFR